MGSSGISLAKYDKQLVEKYWDYEKNEILPDEIGYGSNEVVHWICDKGHTFEARVKKITTYGFSCPYCINRKVLKGYNDLETTHPPLVQEWDYELNGDNKPEHFHAGSSKRVHWVCKDCGHKWEAQIFNRAKNNTGCPECWSRLKKTIGYSPKEGQSALELYPHLEEEWDFSLNDKTLRSTPSVSAEAKVYYYSGQQKSPATTYPNLTQIITKNFGTGAQGSSTNGNGNITSAHQTWLMKYSQSLKFTPYIRMSYMTNASLTAKHNADILSQWPSEMVIGAGMTIGWSYNKIFIE